MPVAHSLEGVADLSVADLSVADLSIADLSIADLSIADLSVADLSVVLIAVVVEAGRGAEPKATALNQGSPVRAKCPAFAYLYIICKS